MEKNQTDTQVAHLPIVIGSLQFYFNCSDENLNRVNQGLKELAARNAKTEEDVEQIIKEGFELYLGKGSYEELYAQTPSRLLLEKTLQQLVSKLGESIKELVAFNCFGESNLIN